MRFARALAIVEERRGSASPVVDAARRDASEARGRARVAGRVTIAAAVVTVVAFTLFGAGAVGFACGVILLVCAHWAGRRRRASNDARWRLRALRRRRGAAPVETE